jgi:hypothetical protein
MSSRDAVLRSLQGGFWIILGLGALLVVGWLAWVFGKAFFYDVPAEYISDIRKEKAQGGPWLAGAVLGVGLPFGMAWIAGMMLHKWGWADLREYTEVAGQVWYVLMPTFLVLYTWSGLKKHYRSIPAPLPPVSRRSSRDGATSQSVRSLRRSAGSRNTKPNGRPAPSADTGMPRTTLSRLSSCRSHFGSSRSSSRLSSRRSPTTRSSVRFWMDAPSKN